MTDSAPSYEPHLDLCELSLAPGDEWTPRPSGWSLCQINSGAGYWLHPCANQELLPGTLIMRSGQSLGSVRASQLGPLSLFFFHVEPGRLTGLMSLGEQVFFETAPVREKVQILPSSNPIAMKMKALCASPDKTGCFFRLQLLELFFEVFEPALKRQIPSPEAVSGVKDRLREFLDLTPASDLLHLSSSELSQRMRCTTRHLSRTFQEVVGIPFREKQTELRLARARELLIATDSKIVDVALESGFQSLSLFNMMFRRRFGVSPGKWREDRRTNKGPKAWFTRTAKHSLQFQSRLGASVAAGSSASLAGIGLSSTGSSLPSS